MESQLKRPSAIVVNHPGLTAQHFVVSFLQPHPFDGKNPVQNVFFPIKFLILLHNILYFPLIEHHDESFPHEVNLRFPPISAEMSSLLKNTTSHLDFAIDQDRERRLVVVDQYGGVILFDPEKFSISDQLHKNITTAIFSSS